VTLLGNNTYVDGTIVSNGTLQVGSGGTVGSIGAGGATIGGAGSRIVFNRSDAVTVNGLITGDGSLVQQGPGTLTLNASNTITGSTTVSNGTLVVASSVNGDLNVNGGTLAVGGLSTAASIHVGLTLNVNSGTVVMPLNKSLSPLSNSFVTADVGFSFAGGSLRLTNVGPALVVGDKFTLFSQPIAGGAGVTITSSGFTVANNLATDGSVTIATVTVVQPPAPTLGKVSISGTNIVITATNNSGAGGNYSLLSTNNLKAPLSTWPVISSGTFDPNGNLSLTNPIGSGAQFFILERLP